MALKNPLLVLTNKQDTTADLVVIEAERRGVPCFRVNTEDLPRVRSSCEVGPSCSYSFSLDSVLVEVTGNAGVWIRRPEPPQAQEWDSPTSTFVGAQWQDFIEGLEAVEGVRWMSAPAALRRAENKVQQLACALRAGFSIPSTCITSDAGRLRQFRGRHPRIVAKALSSALFETQPEARFAYTVEVTDDNAPGDDELRVAPVVFQELLAPATHYRVTVVGGQVFAARVHPSTPDALDWRQAATPPGVTPIELSRQVAAPAIRLLKLFGLTFSSMDLMEVDGEMYFLDLNPNGEWGWLQKGAELPIAEAVVAALAPEQ